MHGPPPRQPRVSGSTTPDTDLSHVSVAPREQLAGVDDCSGVHQPASELHYPAVLEQPHLGWRINPASGDPQTQLTLRVQTPGANKPAIACSQAVEPAARHLQDAFPPRDDQASSDAER
eukprot:1911239-Rhodomonas_salina.2